MKALLAVLGIMWLVGACAPAEPANACHVARLAQRPALAGDLGGLGQPPQHLTDAEVDAVAKCMTGELDAVFARVPDRAVRATADWRVMSKAYRASEHGMFLQVYANPVAAASYARYEAGERLAPGAAIIKRSFKVDAAGNASPFAVFVMERMAPGFAPDINDWRFAVIAPDGTLIGETNGPGADKIGYCAECHQSARKQDLLLFVPPRYRLVK